MGTAIAYLELDTSKFSKGFVSAYNDLKVFGDKSATAEQKLNGLQSALKTTGGLISKNVTVPLAGVGAVAVKASMDFEKQMSAVQAISGATGSEFDALRDKAVELGASTTFSASEVAEAMTEMAKAGWSSQQVIDGIGGVLDAAAASGEELASVGTIVADAITTFGLSASESARVADLLTQSANAGTISVSDLGEAFKYIGPVANTMGFSIEDVTTAITALSTAGIKGSQAGTTLRSMFARMVKPTDDVAAAMDELGITLADSEGNFYSMNDILEQMRSKFSKLTPEQQTYYATVLAGQEGMSGLTTLLGMTQEEYDKIAKSMQNATGVASETAKVMQDNLAGAVEQLGGALESAGIVIGDRLTPYIRKLAEWITTLVDDFNSLSEEQQDQIVKWALIAAGIGPVLTVGGKVLSLTSSLVKGGKTLATGIGTLTTSVSNYKKALVLANAGMGDTAENLSGLYKGITALKTGMGGFGVVYGSVIALATTGVALTALGIKEQQKRIDKLAELTEQEQLLADSIKEQNEAYEQIQQNRTESIENANKEAEATQLLADKLSSVVDENGKVLAGKESYAEFIASELSDALGQEVSIVDGQVQGYKDLMSAIDDVITKQKALAIQEATHDDYVEAIKNQTQAQRNYAEQLQVVFEAEENYKQAKSDSVKYQQLYDEAVEKGLPTMGEYREKWEEATEAEAGAKKKLDEVTNSLDDSANALEGYNQTVENYEGLGAAIISGSADEIEAALLKVQQGFLTANTATKESLEEQVEDVKTQYENMKNALEQGVPGVTQEMVDQLATLVDEADAELTNKITQDKEKIKETFKQIGLEAPQSLIDAFYEKDSEVQQGVTNIMTNLTNGVQVKGEELKTLFENIGVDAPQSLIEQMEQLEPSVQLQAVELLTQLQYGEESKRPEVLEQMKQLGISVDDSVAEGVMSNTDKVKKASGNVGAAGNKEMQNKMSKQLKSPSISNDIVSKAASIAESARSAMQAVFNRRAITATISAVGAGAAVINGSHASGLDYVPYNGYVAELHEGERVLTKQQNREYNDGRTGQGGDTFNFYNTKPTPYEYARQMKKAKRDLALGY